MSRSYIWLPLSFLIALFSTRRALASPIFPGTIQTNLGLTYALECTLCHDTNDGQKNTANRPVGRKVRSYGLMGEGDTQALITILGKMRDAKDDSDQDGVSDIDELKAGTDPNINDITGEPPEDYPPPVYGCHANGSRAGAVPPYGGSAAVAAGLAGFLSLRMRMRRRASRVPRKDV